MFGHVLVPLDSSSLAERVLPHVVAFARLGAARVSIAHVLEPPTLAGRQEPTDPVQWQLETSEAEQYLVGVRQRLATLGVSVEHHVFEGDPTSNLVDFAQRQGVDLMALTSHGQSGLMGWNLGAVAHKLATHARTSLLLVRAFGAGRAAEDVRYQRLLLPLDGSRRAESVLQTASHLADEHGAHLLLAHVVERLSVTSRLPLPGDAAELAERFLAMRQEHGERYLATVREELASVTRNVEAQVSVADDPMAELHDLSDAHGADLLLMSAHGASGSPRWPFGGTALNVLVYGTKTLLVVQDLPRDEVRASAAERAARERQGHE